MAIRRFVLASLLISVSIASSVNAVTVQQEDWILSDGSPVLWLEAESLMENDGTPDDTRFLIVDSVDPYITTDQAVNGELPALPEDTNAFGGKAIMDMLGGPFIPTDMATYEVQFAYPGRYYLFAHYTMYNADGNINYLNEDSIFLPPSFNANPGDDWIGFEGVNVYGDPKTGDSRRDGWMPLGKTIVSKGDESVHNNVDEEFWDGTFHWGWFEEGVDNDANDTFIDGPGHGIRYIVTEDQVGETLTFQISAREHYSVLDGFLFSQSKRLLSRSFTQEELTDEVAALVDAAPTLGCDVDGNGVCDANDIDAMSQQVIDGISTPGDRASLIESPAPDGFNTWIGDADLNGRFDEQDFVAAFIAGKYLSGGSAGWAQGDFDGNLTFDEQDFVSAFIAGGYLQGERSATAAVPEPSAAVLLALGLFLAAVKRR